MPVSVQYLEYYLWKGHPIMYLWRWKNGEFNYSNIQNEALVIADNVIEES